MTVGGALVVYSKSDLEDEERDCLRLCYPEDWEDFKDKTIKQPTYKTKDAVSPYDENIEYAVLYLDAADQLCTPDTLAKEGVKNRDNFCSATCGFDWKDVVKKSASNAGSGTKSVFDQFWGGKLVRLDFWQGWDVRVVRGPGVCVYCADYFHDHLKMGNSGPTSKILSKNVTKTQASFKRAENMLAKPSKVQDLTKLQSHLEQDAAMALVRLQNAQDIEKSKRIKYKTLVNTSLRVKGEITKKMQEREKPTFSSGNA